MIDLTDLYFNLHLVAEAINGKHLIESSKIDLLLNQMDRIWSHMNGMQKADYRQKVLQHKKLDKLHEQDTIDYTNYEVGSGGSSSKTGKLP